MTALDKFDFRLIAELESDSRQTLSQIAKKLNTSQQVVSYRIGLLRKKAVIDEFFPIIDFAALGYTGYRTMIRLTNMTEPLHKEIISYLNAHSNVLWFVDCGGRWDLIVNFLAKNIVQYTKFLKDFKNKFPQQIQNCDVLTTIEIVYFGRDYFSKKERALKKVHPLGRDSGSIKLDKLDLQILDLISRDARANSVDVAAKLSISPNTVILRLKKLRETVIQGFKPLIHLENTPFSGYKSLIKLQNITEQREKEIVNYLKMNVSIVGIGKLVGLWDLEIEFETDSKEKMLSITRDFRDKFKDVIKEFETIPLFHEYKYDFFPGDVLEK
jgi:Lrp/AsnC family leucine-responsive transcriptional regulator